MKKDDYFVIVYRILAYLYECLKKGEKPSAEYLEHGTEAFPVNQIYWSCIVRSLQERGYIKGVHIIPVVGADDGVVEITPSVHITMEGVVFLQENSTFERVKKFLKEIKEIVPGI